MSIEKERMSVNNYLPPWVIHEHQARYEFAGDFVKDKFVVDGACGAGIGSVMFASAGARQVWAYDLSLESITASQAKNNLSNLTWLVADVTQLPLENSMADVWICLETIEHIANDEKLLVEAKRVLKPGGILVCSTPNRRVTNPQSSVNDKPFNQFHVREYSQSEFENLLKKHFASIEWYGQNPQSPWRIKFFDWIARKFSSRIAARLAQVLKLPRLLYDKPGDHRVQKMELGKEYEYLVAVCK
jgi:ubiquinone/menaquinone biosynthesis C-methylase UbiE